MSRSGAAFVRRHALTLLILAGAVGTALDVALRHGSALGPRTPLWFAVPAVAVLWLPLLGRFRWPFAAPAALWLLGVLIAFVDGRLIVFTAGATLAGLVAAFFLGQVSDDVRGRLGLAVVVLGAVTVVDNDPHHAAPDLVFVPLPFVVAWLAGWAVRERTSRAEAAEARVRQAERERETAARIAVAEERTRIARELHDIVAHAMSVIVLHAGAVRHNLPDALTDEREALAGIERTGRTALAEMRRLLGALGRDDDDTALAPQPGLGRLDPLLQDVRRAGLSVRLEIEGEPYAVPPTLDLSAYRVVQEGLTNTLKHADASHAEVVVRYGPDELGIDIRDDGTGRVSSNGGRGLVGIRERVHLYGGAMSAGPAAGGGFRLSARFPLELPRGRDPR